MCNQVQITNSFFFCKHPPDAVGSVLLLCFLSPVNVTATPSVRDENYMQNVIFRGRFLNPQTAEESTLISTIMDSWIPGGTS